MSFNLKSITSIQPSINPSTASLSILHWIYWPYCLKQTRNLHVELQLAVAGFNSFRRVENGWTNELIILGATQQIAQQWWIVESIKKWRELWGTSRRPGPFKFKTNICVSHHWRTMIRFTYSFKCLTQLVGCSANTRLRGPFPIKIQTKHFIRPRHYFLVTCVSWSFNVPVLLARQGRSTATISCSNAS